MTTLYFQVHGKDAILAYDSDDSLGGDNNSVSGGASSPPAPTTNNGTTNTNTNSNSHHLPTSATPPSSVGAPVSAAPPPALHNPAVHHTHGSAHLFHHPHHHHMHHQNMHQTAAATMQSDFKPLTDWYSHAGMMASGMRYDTAGSVSVSPVVKHSQATSMGNMMAGHHQGVVGHPASAGTTTPYVSAALPTPPSTGHSPIQSLSHHLPHLLPSSATSVAYT